MHLSSKSPILFKNNPLFDNLINCHCVLSPHFPSHRLTIPVFFRSDDRRSHQLRYVLRNKATGDVYLVVVFSLFLREDLNEDGTLKEGAQQHKAGGGGAPAPAAPATEKKPEAEDQHDHDEDAALKRARDEFGEPPHETSVDDLD